MTNALLDMTGLPPFSRIEPPMVEPAIDALLQANRQTMESLLNTIASPSWGNFVEPLEVAEDRLSRTWSPVSHMNSVVNHDELRVVTQFGQAGVVDFAQFVVIDH
ncbi:MAG: hypothetical protein N0E55_17000 [Candidatus Thiodiazotropha taylori]|nr:hypothetical protein [Candidatus Thiodiazotropha taylori]MCW4254387.1 hypothetical protein [Candidatus Thiodiazotropha taylori]